MLGSSTLESAEGRVMSRYTLALIVLAALSLAAVAGNIIWGD
jgi:hypothetical protein